jgi:uncharacterized protein YfiM (DUF2279 family)
MLILALLLLTASETAIVQDEPAGTDSLDETDSLTIMPEMKRVISDSWFGQDKILHFSAGFAIPGLTYHFYTCRLNGDEQRGKVYAVSLTALLAFGKEFYDKKKKGHFSWKDLAWGGLGLAVGYFVMIH